MSKSRNVGIDFLRIGSMLMILLAHILKGNVSFIELPGSADYYILWTVKTVAAFSVNCFAMLTGYLMVNKPFALRRVVSMWMQVYFYSVLIFLCVLIFAPYLVTTEDIYSTFLPTIKSNYWYVTSYICLFFFMPFLNIVINRLSPRGLTALSAYVVITISVLPYILSFDIIGDNAGYSVLWMAGMYILGAYIKKMGPIKWLRTWNSAVIFILSMGASCGLLFLRGVNTYLFTDPFILLASFVLFVWAVQYKWKNGPVSKLITFLGPLSFSAYLIHAHPLLWNKVIMPLLISYSQMFDSAAVFLLSSLGISAVALVVCSLVDAGRSKLFRLARLDKLASRIESILVICFTQYKSRKYKDESNQIVRMSYENSAEKSWN